MNNIKKCLQVKQASHSLEGRRIRPGSEVLKMDSYTPSKYNVEVSKQCYGEI